MTYRAVDDVMPLAQQHHPAHAARVEEFAGEEFIDGDPFVRHGVVAEWSVRPWNEVLQT